MLPNTLQDIKFWMGEFPWRITLSFGGTIFAIHVGFKVKRKLEEGFLQQYLKRWENTKKDEVILHTLHRDKTVPSLSPDAVKLETFLRVAKIPYKLDFDSKMSPGGKMPWATINGKHIADTDKIIAELTKDRRIALGDYNDEQRAIGQAVSVLLDKHLVWGIALWRYVYSDENSLHEIFNMPDIALQKFHKSAKERVEQAALAHSVDIHSKEEIIGTMNEVLRRISLILDRRPYLLGDDPCEADCSLFAYLSIILWASQGSPYARYIQDEVPNLLDYNVRMRGQFWNDWFDCISTPKGTGDIPIMNISQIRLKK